MKLRKYIALIIFGVIFLQVGSMKVQEYISLRNIESIYVKDFKSLSVNSNAVDDYQSFVTQLNDFIVEHDDYTFSLVFNDTVSVQIMNLSNGASFPIVSGNSTLNDGESEVLVGMYLATTHDIKEPEIGSTIDNNGIAAKVSGKMGTPTFMSELNIMYTYDLDTLSNNPEIFAQIVTINISNPQELREFETVVTEFSDLLKYHGVKVQDGNSMYGGIETSVREYTLQVALQLSGLFLLLVFVLGISSLAIIKEERRLYSIYKLLGCDNKSLFLIEMKSKLIILIQVVSISVLLVELANLIYQNQYIKISYFVLIYYLAVNLLIYGLWLLLMYRNIFYRKIRWDL